MRGIYWIDLAQDRVTWRARVKAVMNLRVPYNERNFSRRTMLHGGSKRLLWKTHLLDSSQIVYVRCNHLPYINCGHSSHHRSDSHCCFHRLLHGLRTFVHGVQIIYDAQTKMWHG
jgi:hypothetical protein